MEITVSSISGYFRRTAQLYTSSARIISSICAVIVFICPTHLSESVFFSDSVSPASFAI